MAKSDGKKSENGTANALKLLSNSLKFRTERFVDKDVASMGLVKIGEYQQTSIYEPSIRGMKLPLSVIRTQVEMDRKSSERFNLAWKAAVKLYKSKAASLSTKFQGPEEYRIALICFTLDEPFKVYEDFNKKCRQFVTDTWTDFPYKGLLYLLIQAEMRMTSTDSGGYGMQTIRHPITKRTDLDSSIQEEQGDLTGEESEGASSSAMSSKIVDTVPRNDDMQLQQDQQQRHNCRKLFRGLEFPIDENDFQPRTLVAFSQLLSTTLDGFTLTKRLESLGKRVTLVEIHHVSWSSRFIAPLSVFPLEREVIIWPWIKFYVEDRKMIGENVEKIVLRPTCQSFLAS